MNIFINKSLLLLQSKQKGLFMKKKLICTLFAVSMFATQVYATDYAQFMENRKIVPGGVLCNAERTKCTVGYYTMKTTSSKKPLYVNDGILCNYDRTKCTYGYSFIKSLKPIY